MLYFRSCRHLDSTVPTSIATAQTTPIARVAHQQRHHVAAVTSRRSIVQHLHARCAHAHALVQVVGVGLESPLQRVYFVGHIVERWWWWPRRSRRSRRTQQQSAYDITHSSGPVIDESGDDKRCRWCSWRAHQRVQLESRLECDHSWWCWRCRWWWRWQAALNANRSARCSLRHAHFAQERSHALADHTGSYIACTRSGEQCGRIHARGPHTIL